MQLAWFSWSRMSYSCRQDVEESIHTKLVPIGWTFCEIWVLITFVCHKISTWTLGGPSHFTVINYCAARSWTCHLLTAQSTLQSVTLTSMNDRVLVCSDISSNPWVIADKLEATVILPYSETTQIKVASFDSICSEESNAHKFCGVLLQQTHENMTTKFHVRADVRSRT